MSTALSLSQTTLPMKLGGEYDVIYHSEPMLVKILTGTVTELTDANFPRSVTSIRDYMFQGNSQLEIVDLSNITNVGLTSFSACSITELNLPGLQTAGIRAFSNNPIERVMFPALVLISSYLFQGCSYLIRADFQNAEEINSYVFYDCTNLDTLILRKNAIVSLNGQGTFINTKIASGEGYIYVPANLVESYQAAEGWSDFSSQIRSIELLEVE